MKIIKEITKWILALIFVAAGINHFLNPAFYLKIMPPILPFHLFLVYLSGVFEMIFGGLLLVPRFSRSAAWALIALLIAVFPANIYMAMNAQIFSQYSETALFLRLPLQFVLIGWAFWYTKR